MMQFILGPCQLELDSLDVAVKIQEAIDQNEQKFGEKIEWIFKASYDKANRTSVDAKRGLGMDRALVIFDRIKNKLDVPIITDVHSVNEIQKLAASSIIKSVQIPAFLCRQTDMIEAAAKNFYRVNIKKGQFLAPSDVKFIIEKFAEFTPYMNPELMITERGTTFGYNNLVVDMRGFREIREDFNKMNMDFDMNIVFDATHSAQKPGGGVSSGGNRRDVPSLACAATATGYVDTIFMEVHPDPDNAPSDGPNSLYLHDLSRQIEKIITIKKAISNNG